MKDVFTIETDDEWQAQVDALDEAQNESPAEEMKTETEELPKTEYLKYIQTATELMAKNFPETKWIVPTILSEGATVFAGAPKQGKSWMALNIALAVASGASALGKIQVEKGDVLYLALEDGAKRMQKRLKSLLNDKPIPAGLNFAFNFPVSNEGGLETVKEWLKITPNARLIVVDTLKRFRPIERMRQNIYNIDYDAVSGLNDLAQEYGVSALVVTHTNKQDSDDMDWFHKVSGSLGLTGAVDAAMLLERPRNETQGKLSISGRDTEEKELAVQFEGIEKGWTLLGEAFSNTANKIRGWLSGAGRDGLSRSDINKMNGNRADGVEDALRELEAAKIAEAQKFETNSRPQERWFLIDAVSA